MRSFLIVFTLTCFFISCKNENKYAIDVSHIPITIDLQRFDVDFYTTTSKTLGETKRKYPMFFPHNIDSVWVNKLNNKDEQELFTETQKLYKDVGFLKEELKELFQYVSYYNPKFRVPKVITMLTDIDYDNRIVLTDEFLLISLDAYLGKKHAFYNDYPNYISQNNYKDRIIVDVANAIINKQVQLNRKRKFIDKMVAEGKKMYLLDSYLPWVTDEIKIGYKKEKFNWAISGEEEVWRYFIEKEILYSTDAKLNKRFLDIAPFSKFYLGEDNLSPGQIGIYIGWQIVRAYMRNNDVSLPQLMKTREEEIFKKSKYKPKR